MSAVLVSLPVGAVREKAGRLPALDMTKGILVVCMVIYHALNYTTDRDLAFRYFAFLPPSFIVITGFLLASVYSAKHRKWDWQLPSRLVSRAGKLLALFTLLNVVIHLVGVQSVYGAAPGWSLLSEYWFEIYLSGEGRIAAFEVLLPIAYLLLLGPLLLFLARLHRLALPLTTAGVVAILCRMTSEGGSWLNAELISAGLIGFILGGIPLSELGKLPRYALPLGIAYGIYFAVGRLHGQEYPIQILGAVLALALIYSICARVEPPSAVGRCLGRLGCYSLVSYIGQIAILQVMVRLIGRPDPSSPSFFLLLLGTLILTALGVEFVNWARCHSALVDGAYRAIFA